MKVNEIIGAASSLVSSEEGIKPPAGSEPVGGKAKPEDTPSGGDRPVAPTKRGSYLGVTP